MSKKNISEIRKRNVCTLCLQPHKGAFQATFHEKQHYYIIGRIVSLIQIILCDFTIFMHLVDATHCIFEWLILGVRTNNTT